MLQRYLTDDVSRNCTDLAVASHPTSTTGTFDSEVHRVVGDDDADPWHWPMINTITFNTTGANLLGDGVALQATNLLEISLIAWGSYRI